MPDTFKYYLYHKRLHVWCNSPVELVSYWRRQGVVYA